MPCGRCVGCRIDRSLSWAIRCSHEASLYRDNCFLTLTYDDEHLPEDNSLNVVHFQQFMKRLRKSHGKNIRFYHCGEYGEKSRRPHYHALLFNHDFSDKRLHQTKNDNDLFISKELSRLWPWGFCLIGAATFQSAGYVARYIMKKQTGNQSQSHYQHICPKTGLISQLAPEYTTMSRRPGLGDQWIAKYWRDVYPEDFVVVNNRKYRPPVYYDRWLEINQPLMYRQLKQRRIRRARENADDSTAERLAVREFIKMSRLAQLPRELEA